MVLAYVDTLDIDGLPGVDPPGDGIFPGDGASSSGDFGRVDILLRPGREWGTD
jgi:hypothetical protein